jgi:hypothetical protein
VLGPRTTQALIAFQRQQGFQASGQIDTQTVSALGLSNMTGQQGSVGAGQSTTSGQGGGNAQQAPANQNVGAGQPSTSQSTPNQNAPANQSAPANQNMGAGQEGNQGAGQPATTGQGSAGAQQPASIKMSDETTRPASPVHRRRKTAIRMPAHRSRAAKQNNLGLLP